MRSPMVMGPIVATDWLADHLADVRVIDMSWSLFDHSGGRDKYEAGHIPGAVFVHLEHEITGPDGRGRHPLPTREQFQNAMRRAGVNNGDTVVVYDDGGGASAGRLWWLLRAFGHEKVAILDGGVQAWTGELEKGVNTAEQGNFTAQELNRAMFVTQDEVLSGSPIVDVRAPERFRGENEPVDPVGGHIPGAKSAPYQTYFAADGTLLPPDELRKLLPAKAVYYCGSGVNACLGIIAAEVAGLGPARLYPGSWSEWCRTPGAGVATGSD